MYTIIRGITKKYSLIFEKHVLQNYRFVDRYTLL